jgi:hypothetical protein
MGYGLEVNVPLLVNKDPRFDVVLRHYRAFNLETGPATGMDLMVHPAKHSRFSTFLELIQRLDEADSSTVLMVNHGKSNANDDPLGLWLPLTGRAPQWDLDEFTLGILAKFIGFIPDDDQCRKEEKDSILDGASMPAGTLKPLTTALQNFRLKRKLKRLELRACNLGGNSKVMELLGMVLGVRTVVAPKVHMFYLGPSLPLPVPFIPESRFDDWLTGFPRARTFTESVAGHPRRFAIQVNGRHSFRTADCATTALDVKWFIEKYVCPGSGYVPATPARHAHIAPFTFSGMDNGNSFVLAQEDAYEAQLVAQDIPRVRLTLTVERK